MGNYNAANIPHHPMDAKGSSSILGWMPFILQSILLLGAALTWSIAQEHRYTVLEMGMKAAAAQIEEQRLQLYTINSTLQRLVDLQQFNKEMEERRRNGR